MSEFMPRRLLSANAARAEPDGEVVVGTGSLNDLVVIKWISSYHPKVGDKIYAAPPAQEGMVMVPMEPTREMIFAGEQQMAKYPLSFENIAEVFKAMLCAARRRREW